MTRRVACLLVTVLLAAACAGPARSPAPGSGSAQALNVVTTSNVFADLVRRVGGERVTVRALVQPGGEVHTFDPAPSDAVAVSGASLLVLNGLGLDDWLVPFAQQAGAANLPILRLGENLDEVEYIEEAEPGAFNPHLWLNPVYAQVYVDRIRLKLIELDPAGQTDYDANADAYHDELAELDAHIRQQFESVPEEQRRVVSFHDAFPYFAQEYGLEIVSVIVEAPGQDPSAADIAALEEAIRGAQVRAILSEVQFSDELAQTIAADTGAQVISDLYTDSLGDPPLDSYVAAIRHDVERITDALKQ